MSETNDPERLLMKFAEFGIVLQHALAESVERLQASPEFVSNAGVDVLLSLDLEGPLRPGRIGEMTGLSSGGVTKLIDRLENDGLVTRQSGVPGDARGVEVRITPTGSVWVRAVVDAFADHLPDVEVLLKEMTAAIEEND